MNRHLVHTCTGLFFLPPSQNEKMPRSQPEALSDEGFHRRAPLVGYMTFFLVLNGGGGVGVKNPSVLWFQAPKWNCCPKEIVERPNDLAADASLEYKKSVWMVEVKRAKGEGRGTEMLICRFSSQPVSTQAGLAVTMTATSTKCRFWSNNLWDVAIATLAGKGSSPQKKFKKKHNLLRWLDSTHPLHIKAIFLFKYNLICFKIYILRVTDGFIACSQSIFLSLV